MEYIQIVLAAKGCSGRGVRLRLLSPGEHDEVVLRGAQMAQPDGPAAVVRASQQIAQIREALLAMLCEVTVQTGFTGPDDLRKEGVTWHKLTSQELQSEGPWSYDALFNSKEDSILGVVYSSNHAVTKEEIDDIVGKQVRVSAD